MNYFLSLVFFLFLPMLLFPQQTTPAATPFTASSAAHPAIAWPHTALDFFARARQVSDLIAAGIPFHLKATYVATGDAEFTGNGTFEEWWESKDLWRKEATLGSYRWVQIKNGGEPAIYTSSMYVPLRLRQVVRAVPMSFQFDTIWESDCQIQHKRLSGIDFTVVSQPYMAKGPGHPVGLVESYYFSPEGALQIWQIGDLATFYNDFQPFQNLLVPRKINIALDKTQIVIISVENLEPLQQNGATISAIPVPPKNLDRGNPDIKRNPHVKAAKLLYQPFVTYPWEAKLRRMQGIVVVDATICENGKVREPYVVLSAGELLDNAALEAVRQYRYEPVMMDGKPVEVETTIRFNFVLNH